MRDYTKRYLKILIARRGRRIEELGYIVYRYGHFKEILYGENRGKVLLG